MIENSAEIIRDIERFRERTGAYPAAISSLWPDYQPGIIGVERYRYEPSGQVYNLYFEHPSTDFATRRDRHGTTPAANRTSRATRSTCCSSRQRTSAASGGTFRSEPLAQANWKRFLFD